MSLAFLLDENLSQAEPRIRCVYLFRGSAGADECARKTDDPATGLIYLRARHYDPATGRFLSPDPFSGMLQSPISRQKYLYSNDTPTNASDPTGMLTLTDLVTNNFIQGILLASFVQVSYGILGSLKSLNHWDGPNYFATIGPVFGGVGFYTTNTDSSGKKSEILAVAEGVTAGKNINSFWAKQLDGVSWKGDDLVLRGIAAISGIPVVGANIILSSEDLLTSDKLFGRGEYAGLAVTGAYVAANFDYSGGIAFSIVTRLVRLGFEFNAHGKQVSSEGFSIGYSLPNDQNEVNFGFGVSLSVGFSGGFVLEDNVPDERDKNK